MDVHKYIRKVNIQRYLISNPVRTDFPAATSGTVHSSLSNPSLFSPPVPIAPAVKIFRDLVLRDLAKLPLKRTHHSPLLKGGLESLCARKDLVVRPADKGGGIVILDKSQYETEMHRILNEPGTYQMLPNNPTHKYKQELQELVLKGYELNILNKRERDFLIPSAPRIPTIYYLPKVHKDPVCPPGIIVHVHTTR